MAVERFAASPPPAHENPFQHRLEPLDPTEEQDIDVALHTVIDRASSYSRDHDADEAIHAECDANQIILSFGARALPYLAEKAKKQEITWYTFSRYLDAVDNPNNLSLAVMTLEDAPEIIKDSDTSAIVRISNYLGRRILEARTHGQDTGRLQNLSKRLGVLMEEPGINPLARQQLARTLLLTGTERARILLYGNPALTDYDRSTYDISRPNLSTLIAPLHFATWDEIQKTRQQNRVHRPAETRYRNVASDETEEEDYRRLASDPDRIEFDVSTRIIDQSRHVDDVMDLHPEIESTATPAVKLYLYNRLTAFKERKPYASAAAIMEYLETAILRLARLSAQERLYAKPNNPLPTIGVEIEIPRSSLTADKRLALNWLGIPNESANDADDDLWEVNPDFSYSPWVQAQILQELANLGTIHLQPKEKDAAGRLGKMKGAPSKPLSLHINFGLPKEVAVPSETFEQEAVMLNDLLIYAFASPERILQRKTSESLLIKGDAKSSKKPTSGSPTKTQEEDMSLRLELRANEFKDFPTFRLLAESQRIVSALYSYAKRQNGIKLTTQEEQLAIVWDDLSLKIQLLFAERGLYPNTVDTNKYHAAIVLRTTELKKKSRALVAQAAREVGVILRDGIHEIEI